MDTWTDFVCQDTGITLQIRKIPTTLTGKLIQQYEKDFPPPAPPTNLIDYGDGEKIAEPNYSNPVYARLFNEYRQKRNVDVEEKIRHLFTDQAIQCEVDKERVKKVRAQMKTLGVELDPDDKYVYVWDVAVGTQDGYADLMKAIQTRVTPEAVQAAKSTFPS